MRVQQRDFPLNQLMHTVGRLCVFFGRKCRTLQRNLKNDDKKGRAEWAKNCVAHVVATFLKCVRFNAHLFIYFGIGEL